MASLYMSAIYNIGLFVMAFRTGSSGQELVFYYTHNDNNTSQYNLDELWFTLIEINS